MKKLLYPILIAFFLSTFVFAQQPNFETWFENKTLRVDYHHTGDSDEQTFALDELYQEGEWAGTTTNLIDQFNQGRYYVKVYDVDSDKLLYSRGFDSIFGEYQTTTPAQKGIKRTYHESVLIPYPRDSVRLAIESRDKQNKLHEVFSQTIDPDDVNIIKEPADKDIEVINVVKSGDPHTSVDVAILAEGYTASQLKKVKSDLEKFKKVFFKQEPYKSHMDKFNVYGVFKPSDESGTDQPTHGSFRNTAINSSFNSLGSPRYLLVDDNKTMRDIAGAVPYDALFVMVNSSRYGGGGIYNLYCTFTSDNQWYEYLFVHEFGHSFAGLGDEYYTSSTAYNDFYPQGVEPTEPNITALLDLPNVKWEKYTSEGLEIPTPWAKAKYDSMSNSYQRIRGELNDKIARMKRNDAPEDEIAELEEKSEQLSKEHADKLDAFLENSPYADKVGAFEGAGYSSEGLYRPMLDCIMFSKGSKPYCTVCEQAIINVIEYYTE
ncbi:MAG: IgA Peptidase M64 [Candidatus Marinimicrobia bacterium]|nr:IgA Peptidase M64 [Candidatus Neomarinimicrobiota bacterium]MCF7828027.1 IgA Peptidase M64 [Candidatus Neomarinimicrobiota bacterium]MCF7879218.1 IgA Peptidase M64 [Candidatus Neomarinimicrobiota bacterium]